MSCTPTIALSRHLYPPTPNRAPCTCASASPQLTHATCRVPVRRFSDDYADYVDEALALRRLLGERHPDLPFVLISGSMGACVGLHLAERAPDLFACCVFCAAAVSFDKLKALPKNAILLPILRLLSICVPWMALAEKADPDPEVKLEQERVGLPWFNTGPIRTRYAEVALKYGELAAQNAHLLTMPLLLLHAPHDPFNVQPPLRLNSVLLSAAHAFAPSSSHMSVRAFRIWQDYEGSLKVMRHAASTDCTLIDDMDEIASDGPPMHNLVHADCHRFDRMYIAQIIEWADKRISASRKGGKGKASRAAKSPAKSPAKRRSR